ncbi:MAG: type II toxin-antitoxin system HicA family toxin [Deltaproteobacteria bacterium]|nr:type II toxin-antitoxin system HicA family toxin [Deltaproteobacteria bacterium]
MSKIGYLPDHQTGGHFILRQSMPPHRRLTIPNHRQIAEGTLRAISHQASMGVEESLSSPTG